MPASATRASACASESARDVDRREPRVGAVRGQRDRLGPDAAAGLEHAGTGRVGGVVVEQIDERTRLIEQAGVRVLVVAVDVAGHGPSLSTVRRSGAVP